MPGALLLVMEMEGWLQQVDQWTRWNLRTFRKHRGVLTGNSNPWTKGLFLPFFFLFFLNGQDYPPPPFFHLTKSKLANMFSLFLFKGMTIQWLGTSLIFLMIQLISKYYSLLAMFQGPECSCFNAVLFHSIFFWWCQVVYRKNSLICI